MSISPSSRSYQFQSASGSQFVDNQEDEDYLDKMAGSLASGIFRSSPLAGAGAADIPSSSSLSPRKVRKRQRPENFQTPSLSPEVARPSFGMPSHMHKMDNTELINELNNHVSNLNRQVEIFEPILDFIIKEDLKKLALDLVANFVDIYDIRNLLNMTDYDNEYDQNIVRAVRLLEKCVKNLAPSSSSSSSSSSDTLPCCQDILNTEAIKLLESCLRACIAKFSLGEEAREELEERIQFFKSRLLFILPFYKCIEPAIAINKNAQIINKSIRTIQSAIKLYQQDSGQCVKAPLDKSLIWMKCKTIKEQDNRLKACTKKNTLTRKVLISITKNLINVLKEMRDIETLDNVACDWHWNRYKLKALHLLEKCKVQALKVPALNAHDPSTSDEMQMLRSNIYDTAYALVDSYLFECSAICFSPPNPSSHKLDKKIYLLDARIKFIKRFFKIIEFTNEDAKNNFNRKIQVIEKKLKFYSRLFFTN